MLPMFLLSGLNGFVSVVDEDVRDSEVVLEPQESVSKIQPEDRRKGTRRVRLIGKYKYDKGVHSLIKMRIS